MIPIGFANRVKLAWDDLLSHPKPIFCKLTEEHKPTFHGLRHSYAREQYLRYRAEGFSTLNARQSVAMQLGHGRDQVTKVYLGKHR